MTEVFEIRPRSQRAARIGGKIATYRKIYVPFPPQVDLIEEMDELRHIGLESKGEPQEALIVIQDSFSGKTSAAKRFRQFVDAELPKGSPLKPVVIATCAAKASSRQLVVALLRTIGAKFSKAMQEEDLWEIWPGACARFGVEIVIIDEVQHCSDARFGIGVTNTLKNKLAVGVPIVVLGTRKGEAMFTINDELENRIFGTTTIRSMKWHNATDRQLWTNFCAHLDQAMTKAGIVAKTAGLGGEAMAEALCGASLGRIGLLKKIVQSALRMALKRGAESITPSDVNLAIEIWMANSKKGRDLRADHG